MDLVENICKEFEDELEGKFYKLEDITEADKKILHEIKFDPPSLGSPNDNAGIGKDWPSGRAVYTNKE